jgi:Crp-like helix-turn-helix domain
MQTSTHSSGRPVEEVESQARRESEQTGATQDNTRDAPRRSARPPRHTGRQLLHRYTRAFLLQVAQTASCTRAHSLEERCARWLLMTHDRVGEASFPLAQEFLATMPGVRRAGVGVAAGILQRAGVIRYRRGQITVLERAGLEAASCECYAVVRTHFDRLLGAAPAPTGPPEPAAALTSIR